VTTQHPDLDAERTYLDLAYEHLAAMRARARQAAAITEGAAAAVDSAIAQAHLQHRVGTLDVDVPGLAFGRLDGEDGAIWYVGRRHVEDERGDPVVVDWRAPVSTPFYRATAADPLDLRRRRRFMMTGRQLDDLFDEVFDDPDSVDAAHHGGIPDPLLAELERSRTGEMRDIVATIAAEQDVVIRAPLDTCLVVQGGPGTGKTAVGLHRAAFLLFEHREQLDRQGVLVVGPNPLFLRYIAQVLPSLGETAARQTTVERLVGGRVRDFDTPEAARVKGDARMAGATTPRPPTSSSPPGAGTPRPAPWPGGSGPRCRRPPWSSASSPAGPGWRGRRAACWTRPSRRWCCARAPAASTTSRGPSPSWSSWTRPRRSSTACDTHMATSSSTRPRTSRTWSCGPSPAGARPGR
jgi:hypothetical protein